MFIKYILAWHHTGILYVCTRTSFPCSKFNPCPLYTPIFFISTNAVDRSLASTCLQRLQKQPQRKSRYIHVRNTALHYMEVAHCSHSQQVKYINMCKIVQLVFDDFIRTGTPAYTRATTHRNGHGHYNQSGVWNDSQRCSRADMQFSRARHQTTLPVLHTLDVDETELITDKHNMGNSTITVHKTYVGHDDCPINSPLHTTVNAALWQS